MLLSCTQAQVKEKWQRIATYEDSTVDLNVANVIFSTAFSGRLRFRITLSKAIPLSKGFAVKYKSVIETVEFKCDVRQYRVNKVEMFDGRGEEIDLAQREAENEWKEVRNTGIWERLYKSGCELIRVRKRNP